jgi:hypothetical protein
MNAPIKPNFDPNVTGPGLEPLTPTLRKVARAYVVEQHVRELVAEGWRFEARGNGFTLTPPGAFVREIDIAIGDALDDFEISVEGGL